MTIEEQDKDGAAISSPSSFSPIIEKPWIERNGFAHWAMALGWVVIGLVAFQVLGNLIGLIIIISSTQVDVSTLGDPNVLQDLVSNNLDLFFIGNTSGQLLVILGTTLLMVRMHAVKGKRNEYIRLQKGQKTALITALGIVLVVAAQPLFGFIGWLNGLAFDGLLGGTSMHEFLKNAQDTSLQAINSFLSEEGVLFVALFHVGIIPSFCEEVMFRGYVMRSFEKRMGIAWAIALSSLLFGLYHLQLGIFLALGSIGLLLAILTWASDSLIPAMVGHFVNNGGVVMLTILSPAFAEAQQPESYEPSIPLILASAFITGAIIYLLVKIKRSSLVVDGNI